MLDIKLIRDEPERVKKSILDRGMSAEAADVDGVLGIDACRRALLVEVEELKHERNNASEQIVASCLQTAPVGRLEVRSDAASGPGDHIVEDVVTRVEREHRESGGDAGLDIRSGLQVVCVRTEGPTPTRPANPGDRRCENILERTAGALELARRLLSQDRHHVHIDG